MRTASKSLHICHLTVLNPALHPRIFYREAVSQARAGHRVTVTGQRQAGSGETHGALIHEMEGVLVQELPFTGRSLSERRGLYPMLQHHATQAQADVYWLHTPELLDMVPALREAVPNARFVYDMHEDYRRNLLSPGAWPWGLRHVLAWQARRTERRFVEEGGYVVYAEAAYEGLLDLPPGRSLLLQNKFAPPSAPAPAPERFAEPVLALTGTLAAEWGLWTTLGLWKRLQAHGPVRLHITGFSYDAEFLTDLRMAAGDSPLCRLHLGSKPLPWTDILDTLRTATAVTALYADTHRFRDKLPTKVFEAMGLGSRLICTPGTAWARLVQDVGAGWDLPHEASDDEVAALYTRLRDAHAAGPAAYPAEIWSWEPEADRMIGWLEAWA